MRKIAKGVARYGVDSARKVVLKNPRLKNAVKRVLLAQLSPTMRQGGYEAWLHQNLPDHIGMVDLRARYKALEAKPKISLLLPTYNTDHDFLHDCIKSIQGQIYK